MPVVDHTDLIRRLAAVRGVCQNAVMVVQPNGECYGMTFDDHVGLTATINEAIEALKGGNDG